MFSFIWTAIFFLCWAALALVFSPSLHPIQIPLLTALLAPMMIFRAFDAIQKQGTATRSRLSFRYRPFQSATGRWLSLGVEILFQAAVMSVLIMMFRRASNIDPAPQFSALCAVGYSSLFYWLLHTHETMSHRRHGSVAPGYADRAVEPTVRQLLAVLSTIEGNQKFSAERRQRLEDKEHKRSADFGMPVGSYLLFDSQLRTSQAEDLNNLWSAMSIWSELNRLLHSPNAVSISARVKEQISAAKNRLVSVCNACAQQDEMRGAYLQEVVRQIDPERS